MTQQQDSVWADLVIAMLSVNNQALSKTFALYEALEDAGLFELANLESWTVPQVSRKLVGAGYDRGAALNEIVAERLCSLGLLSIGVDEYERTLAEGERVEVAAALKHVKGVGPMVLQNFLMLRKSARPK